MINANVLSRVRNGVCAVGYLSVPLPEYQRRPQSPFHQVIGTGFLIRNTTVITNRHVIEALLEEQARLGFPSSQFFLSFIVPDQTGQLRNTLRMIRHFATLSDNQIDVGFLEFGIVHQLHFEGIAPLEVVEAPDLRVSEEIAVLGYPYGTAMLERGRQNLSMGSRRSARVDFGDLAVRDGYDTGSNPPGRSNSWRYE